jgi:acetolactate decarboxylase
MLRSTKGARSAILAVLLCLALAAPALGVELYQVSTIEALLAGGYAQEGTFADLARHGDFGLGTVTDLDGEMVALDGVFYQVRSDGTVHVLPPEAGTPFAEVVFFKGKLDLGRVDGLDLDGLKAALTARLPDPSRCYYAARVDGSFAAVTTRSVPAQTKPWPPLAEAVKHQSEFPMQNVRGTLVGIYAPPTAPGLAPTGWHFHFLTADRTRGGHALAATATQGTARADGVDVMTVRFPGQPLPRQAAAGPAPGTE